MQPFSFIKKHPEDTGLDPVAPFLKSTQIIRHDENEGALYSTHSFSIKLKKNEGDCVININPLSGQPLEVAFSYDREEIAQWVESGGSRITSSMSVSEVTASFNKLITGSTTADQYLWFCVGENNNIGLYPINPSYTFGVTLSGNFHSPESLLRVQGSPGSPALGTYLNPFFLAPNVTANHDMGLGECPSGSFYYSFVKSAYVTKNITVEPLSGQSVGFIYSTIKDNLKTWIINNGSGPLTNGANISASPGNPVDFNITATISGTNVTMYGVVYNPSNIGLESCGVNKTYKIFSSQEIPGSGYYGTYTNPYYISNNSPLSGSVTYYHSDGECNKNASIFTFLACSDVTAAIYVQPLDGQDIGVGVTNIKEDLGQFIDTQNYSSLLAYNNTTGGNTAVIPMSATFSGQIYYFVVYNPSTIGTNQCSNPDTFKVGTAQVGCQGGGGGGDGTYNDPFQISLSNTFYGHDLTQGECNEGRIWYQLQNDCGFVDRDLSFQNIPAYNNGDPILAIAWANSKSDLLSWYTDRIANGQFIMDGTENQYGCSNVYNYPYGYQYICQEIKGVKLFSPNSGTNINLDFATDDETLYFITFKVDYVANNPYAYYDDEVTILDSNTCNDPFTYEVYYNFDDFSFDNDDCTYFYPGDGGGDDNYPVGDPNNPYVLSNNDNKTFPGFFGSCAYSKIYFQALLCGEEFTITSDYDNYNQVIGWAKNLSILNQWADYYQYDPYYYDLSPYDGGFSTNNSATFTPSGGLYYFICFKPGGGNSCNDTSTSDYFTVTTTQENCNGPSNTLGTYQVPYEISNNSTEIVNVNMGDCFVGRTYYTTTLCPDISSSLQFTNNNNASPQHVIWTNRYDKIKVYADNYSNDSTPAYPTEVDEIAGSSLGSGDGIGTESISSSLILLPGYISQQTLYICIIDRDAWGIDKDRPRCGSTGLITIQTVQDCPIVDIGGTNSISGAKKYDIDPYNSGRPNKNGIGLEDGDTSGAVLAAYLYSPTLVIDEKSSYPTITCSSIVSELFTNNLSGGTNFVETKTCFNTQVLHDNTNDKVYIKPVPGYELFYETVNLYTSLLRVTYNTSVGVFVRNQVVNAGSTFEGNNEQYVYNIAQNENTITTIIPVVQEYGHTILTSGSNITSYNWGKYNKVNITLTEMPSAGTLLSIPFNTANISGTKIAKLRVK